jgi:hypothetical protein
MEHILSQELTDSVHLPGHRKHVPRENTRESCKKPRLTSTSSPGCRNSM